MFRLFTIAPALVLLPHLAAANPISSEDLRFFEKRIRPLLADHCYKCHAATSKKIKGSLLLDRRAGWVKGGESGEVIVPGKP
ncbi:MAG: c-type cytochrome domain-containing protein, partial [Roseibacillus sp.]|nr:c-type cytochrome domain-containing protein [Roseibacillus sp.]